MSDHFTRNVRNHKNWKEADLLHMEQNDFLSDDKNVFVKNQGKLEQITGMAGNTQGNVSALYFDTATTGVNVLSIVNGNVGSNEQNTSGYYYMLQILFGDGTRQSRFFDYDPDLDRSVARLTLTNEQIGTKKIMACQVEKVTAGDPYKYEIVAYEPLQQSDFLTTNQYDPSFIKNKPETTGGLLGLSWKRNNAEIYFAGDTTNKYRIRNAHTGDIFDGLFYGTNTLYQPDYDLNFEIDVDECVLELIDMSDSLNPLAVYTNYLGDYSMSENTDISYIRRKPFFDISSWYNDPDTEGNYIYYVAGNTEEFQLLFETGTENYYSGTFNTQTGLTEYPITSEWVGKSCEILNGDLEVVLKITLPK